MTIPIAERDVRLSVTYDGPELANGRMDVRLLASAMASVAELVDDATRVTYGTDADVRIEVSGDFRRGSFTYQIVATAIQGLDPSQIKEILTWLGLIAAPTGLTVIGVLKWLRGRKIDRIEPESTNRAKIVVGNQSQVVNLQVAQLVVNYKVRSDIEGMTAPLERPGITELRTGEQEADAMVVRRDERNSFAAPVPTAQKVHEGESVAVLQLVTPNLYKVGNKWQFAYPGESPFFAPVLDENFLGRFQRREVSFSYGDLVRVRLKTIVERTEIGTLTTHREILEILEIISPIKQGDLFTDHP